MRPVADGRLYLYQFYSLRSYMVELWVFVYEIDFLAAKVLEVFPDFLFGHCVEQFVEVYDVIVVQNGGGFGADLHRVIPSHMPYF